MEPNTAMQTATDESQPGTFTVTPNSSGADMPRSNDLNNATLTNAPGNFADPTLSFGTSSQQQLLQQPSTATPDLTVQPDAQPSTQHPTPVYLASSYTIRSGDRAILHAHLGGSTTPQQLVVQPLDDPPFGILVGTTICEVNAEGAFGIHVVNATANNVDLADGLLIAQASPVDVFAVAAPPTRVVEDHPLPSSGEDEFDHAPRDAVVEHLSNSRQVGPADIQLIDILFGRGLSVEAVQTAFMETYVSDAASQRALVWLQVSSTPPVAPPPPSVYESLPIRPMQLEGAMPPAPSQLSPPGATISEPLAPTTPTSNPPKPTALPSGPAATGAAAPVIRPDGAPMASPQVAPTAAGMTEQAGGVASASPPAPSPPPPPPPHIHVVPTASARGTGLNATQTGARPSFRASSFNTGSQPAMVQLEPRAYTTGQATELYAQPPPGFSPYHFDAGFAGAPQRPVFPFGAGPGGSQTPATTRGATRYIQATQLVEELKSSLPWAADSALHFANHFQARGADPVLAVQLVASAPPQFSHHILVRDAIAQSLAGPLTPSEAWQSVVGAKLAAMPPPTSASAVPPHWQAARDSEASKQAARRASDAAAANHDIQRLVRQRSLEVVHPTPTPPAFINTPGAVGNLGGLLLPGPSPSYVPPSGGFYPTPPSAGASAPPQVNTGLLQSQMLALGVPPAIAASAAAATAAGSLTPPTAPGLAAPTAPLGGTASLASATPEQLCAAWGWDYSVLAAEPEWYKADVPADVTGHVQKPLNTYSSLVGAHINNEYDARDSRIGQRSQPCTAEQLAALFSESEAAADVQPGVKYMQSWGSVRVILAQTRLHFLRNGRGDVNTAANKTLQFAVEAARLVPAFADSIPAFEGLSYAGKGDDGIQAMLFDIDHTLLLSSDDEAESKFNSTVWEVGQTASSLLRTLARLGGVLGHSQDRILRRWKAAVRDARDTPSRRTPHPGVQTQINEVVDRFARRDQTHDSVSKLQLALDDDGVAKLPLQARGRRGGERDVHTALTHGDQVAPAPAPVVLPPSVVPPAPTVNTVSGPPAPDKIDQLAAQFERVMAAMTERTTAGGGGGGGGSPQLPRKNDLPPGPLQLDKILQSGEVPELRGLQRNPIWNSESPDGKYGRKCFCCAKFEKDAVDEKPYKQFEKDCGRPSRDNPHMRTVLITHFEPFCRNVRRHVAAHVRKVGAAALWMLEPDPDWPTAFQAAKPPRGADA